MALVCPPRAAVLFGLAASLLVAGCEEKPADAEAAEKVPALAPEPPKWLSEKVDPKDLLAVALRDKAKELAGGLEASGQILRGTLAPGASDQHQIVLKSDRCYRVVGVGGDAMEDLDLLLFDEHDVQVRQDSATDNAPVLGAPDYLCPSWPTAYRLEVRAFKGEGDYAVRVFETDPV